MGTNEILSKNKHSIVFLEKQNKENCPMSSKERGSTSTIRRIGRGGGTPPDSRNSVFLKSRKVVKKKNVRNVLAQNYREYPSRSYG